MRFLTIFDAAQCKTDTARLVCTSLLIKPIIQGDKEMQICQNCGYREPLLDSKYCFKCGSRLYSNTATPQMYVNPAAYRQWSPPAAPRKNATGTVVAIVSCVAAVVIIAVVTIIATLPVSTQHKDIVRTLPNQSSSSDTSVVGTWVARDGWGEVAIEFVFKADGTYNADFGIMQGRGRYKVSGNTLYFTERYLHNGATWIKMNDSDEVTYRIDGDTIYTLSGDPTISLTRE